MVGIRRNRLLLRRLGRQTLKICYEGLQVETAVTFDHPERQHEALDIVEDTHISLRIVEG